MASPQRPAAKTASRCTPETARGTHAFEITGYSLHKGIGEGKFIRSSAFAVGGYDWCICFYPDGVEGEESRDYVSAVLELASDDCEVRARFDIRMVDQVTGLSRSVDASSSIHVFSTQDTTDGVISCSWGQKLMKRSVLEASTYLRQDRLVIEFDVTVIKEARVQDTAVGHVEFEVPPSNLSDNLKELWESEKEADVTFNVKGDVFSAHKIVLAMRSPVFNAELYGPMRDKMQQSITIIDMQPAVFKALLHFIYTDSLPSMDDLDGGEKDEMVKHMLVAADRYAMDRMKLMCESILCERLDAKSVAITLALADRHNCSKLKDACIEFINSLNVMDEVVSSKGYQHLKRSCPAVFADIWEKAARSRKN